MTQVSEELLQLLFKELAPYIDFRVRFEAVEWHWALGKDDLTSEAYFRVFKVVQQYGDCKPLDELLAIARTAIYNRFRDMKYHTLVVQKRRDDRELTSLDDTVIGLPSPPSPENYVLIAERYRLFRESLPTNKHKKVLDIMVGVMDAERLDMFLDLYTIRMNNRINPGHPNRKIGMHYLVIARTAYIGVKQTRELIKDIKDGWNDFEY